MKICRKCKKEFPSSVVVDGKRTSLRNRTFCLECSPFNKHNTRDLCKITDMNGDKWCPCCETKKSFSDFYLEPKKNPPYSSYCKKCNAKLVVKRQNDFKQKCVDYKGGKCEICGYNKCLAALCFHHLDPSQKEFGVSNASRFDSKFTDITKRELDKCKLLCANCHSETHYSS